MLKLKSLLKESKLILEFNAKTNIADVDANTIVDQLEAHGIIGPFRGSKAREVLYADEIRLEEYLSSKGIL